MEPTSLNPNPATTDIKETAAAEHARRSLDEARAGVEELATQGTQAIKSSAARTREAISHTTDQASQYVQAKPLQSLFLATAAGAAIALLAGAIGKRHHEHPRH